MHLRYAAGRRAAIGWYDPRVSRSARVLVALMVVWVVALPYAVNALPMDWAGLYMGGPLLLVLGLLALTALVGALLRLLRL